MITNFSSGKSSALEKLDLADPSQQGNFSSLMGTLSSFVTLCSGISEARFSVRLQVRNQSYAHYNYNICDFKYATC